jgi:hypothetical protein
MTQEEDARKVGLPTRTFLYTIDQVCNMINVRRETFVAQYLYLHGVHTGSPSRDKLAARNVAPDSAKAEWRIAEKEFIRWLRVKGFRVNDSSAVF